MAVDIGNLAEKVLGPKLFGQLEFYLRPAVVDRWGGPFNGQVERTKIFQTLANALNFDCALETGSYRGATTALLVTLGVPVHTIEVQRRYWAYARLRFRGEPLVHTHLGDSRSVLRGLAGDEDLTADRVFAYLDAHWEEDLPLVEELGVLFRRWPRAVIMVDDFCVENDAGYAYDDYGVGKTLNVSLAEQADIDDMQIYFPKANSTQETGHKRGSVILACDKTIKATLDGLDCLRSWTKQDASLCGSSGAELRDV
ncbi:MAG: hypothetical protein ACI8PT_000764 [Gammaproteobacteria bacterium]|jgi:hypothetical protein